MTALGKLAPWRHVLVGGSVAAIGLASLTGVIGEDHSPRFDSKQIVVAPVGTDSIRIHEVVDVDFANQRQHGYKRIVPDDFGIPIDVTATATDASGDVRVDTVGWETRIYVGDADRTITGQHRYTLDYTYPDAQLSSGELALDIIGTEETMETTRFEVVVTGLELADPTCNVGSFGDVGGCELIDDGTTYRVLFEPLEPGQGVTIGGEIVGRRETVAVEPPELPGPRPNHRVPLAIATTLLGALAGTGMYLWAKRRGRNEVFAGGAADAAFGVSALPPPGAAPVPPSPTRLVTDAELGTLATIEFAPPNGVDPWLGGVLLSERMGDDAVAAWLSGHAARDVLAVTKDGSTVTLARGPRFASAPELDRRTLDQMLGASGERVLGKYSKEFAAGWGEVRGRQRVFVNQSGFWKRPIPGAASSALGGLAAIAFVALVVFGIGLGRSALRTTTALDSPALVILLSIALPALVAFGVYQTLLPARTAVGSALALRTESFRRFLAASEAKHVEWAWEHGMLREYSAWAVALGTADAWESAMKQSTVPPAEFSPAPLILFHAAGSLNSARTAPSSSGGRGGGGGFSGGSVGGGGGGGSSGSW